MSLARYLLIRATQAAVYPLYRRQQRFERDCEHPERIQNELLFRTLRRQAGTGFGKDHGFASIRSVADYRRHVPVAPYERLEPYIQRMAAGETSALIADDELLMFALTSGTTAARKLIPVTRRYLQDFKRGWNLWGIRAFRDHRPRDLAFRPIVQMVGDPEEYRTQSGVPCGNLSGFTARVQRRMIRGMYAVPAETGKIADARTRYTLALRMSLARPCSLFTAANPSTLVMLGRTLDAEKDRLLKDLRDGTLDTTLDIPTSLRTRLLAKLKPQPELAARLTKIAAAGGHLYPRHVWHPDTILLGTWTGGSMGPYLRQLPTYYGDTPIRDLGLLASEGRMTIPFANHTPAGVLDIRSHYFEFITESEIDSPRPTVLGSHELSDGANYFIVPTTAAGLYRYAISDLVRVRGFLGRTPMVEFLGKGNRFANLTGEKLSEHHVTQAFDRASIATGYTAKVYALAPVWDDTQPYYGLFIEASDTAGVDRLLGPLDDALGEANIEYRAKRGSGRLGPVRARVLPTGWWTTWDAARLAKTGGTPEQYKHPCLIGDVAFAAGVSPVSSELRA